MNITKILGHKNVDFVQQSKIDKKTLPDAVALKELSNDVFEKKNRLASVCAVTEGFLTPTMF